MLGHHLILADLVSKVYGDYGDTRQLLDNARFADILFLDEGSPQFTLDNGATLLIYASLEIAQIHLQIGFQIKRRSAQKMLSLGKYVPYECKSKKQVA